MQVVIKERDGNLYLKRRGSHGKCQWTEDLQEAQVLTESGAQRAIRAIHRSSFPWYPTNNNKRAYEMEAVRVRIQEER